MNLQQLDAFVAVAREGSFSRAADRVFRTQPAVSQAIGSLEEELGERLFLRLGRRIELTQAGEILLEHARRASHTLEQARLRIEALKGLTVGMLTIGTSDTTACYILPPVLRAFCGLYPGIEVVITNRPSPAILQHVLAHDVDLGIVTLPIEHPTVAVDDLIVREDVVICSGGSSLARRKRMRIEELGDHPLLLLDRGSNTRAFIDRKLAQAGVVPHIAMEIGSIDVIKRLVQLEFGISIVPRVAVQEEVAGGTLHVIKVFAAREARRLGAIYLEERYLSPAAREFLRILPRHLCTG